MRTDRALGLEGFEHRWYDINYQSPDEALSGEVSIICVATRDFGKGTGEINTRKRHCGTARLRRFHGVVVQYSLSQWRLPAPESVSTDPATESGAILQFDKRIREWLVGLERPR